MIAYREIRENFAAILHAVPLKPSHRRIDPAVSDSLQVGTHQQSLFQRFSAGRHPDHAVAMALHPVQPFGIHPSHPRPLIEGGSALRSGRLNLAHNLIRQKVVAPCEKAPPCTWSSRARRTPSPAASPNTIAGLPSSSH